MTHWIRHLFVLLAAVPGSISRLPRVILEPRARSESRATCQMWTPKIRTERHRVTSPKGSAVPWRHLACLCPAWLRGDCGHRSHTCSLFQAHPMPCLPREEKRRGKGEGRKATSRLVGQSVASWAMDNRGPEMFPAYSSL